ncbi:MAG: hypothetical protein PHG06_00335 [Parabacteroides sp.]|nr:hypothetical protein [Parabacteroides sp.]
MALSLSDAILAESFFTVTVGIGSKITNEQLVSLQSLVADDVNNFVGNRAITVDVKTRITACFILDLYANRSGKGTIIQESVTDASWKSQVRTSSQYMDRAYTLRGNVDSTLPDEFDLSGVTRDDASIAMERDNELSRLLFN